MKTVGDKVEPFPQHVALGRECRRGIGAFARERRGEALSQYSRASQPETSR